MHDDTDRPNRLPWPPMLLVACLAAGLALEAAVPTDLGPLPSWIGWLVVGVALGLDAWAMITMARARTNILPHRAADRLVTVGPFALTRNPIYVGNVLLLAGLGLGMGSLWVMATSIADALLTHRLAVLREERHLERRFGSAWSAYASDVPRWLGWPRQGRA